MSLRGCKRGAVRFGIALALAAGVPWPFCGITPAHAVLVQESDPNALYGIGAVLVIQNAAATVAELAPGGAAEKDGQLKPGDVITGVAQGDGAFVDCSALPLDKIVSMVRGKKGTTVRLRVLSAGQPKVVSLVRSVIPQAPQAQVGVRLQGPVIIRNGVAIPMRARAQPEVDLTPKDPLKGLTPGDAAKLEDLLKSVGSNIRTKQIDQMNRKVDEIVAATGLDDKGKTALLAAVPASVDQQAQKTHDALRDMMESAFRTVPVGQIHQILEQAGIMASEVAMGYEQQADVWPDDAPSWQAALKKNLTPAQAAAWNTAQAKQHQELEDQISDYLAMVTRTATTLAQQQIQPEADAIRSAINLPPDRLAKLKDLQTAAVTDFANSMRAKSEKAMLEMPEADRKVAMKGRGDFPPSGVLDEWRAGVAKILSPAEMAGMKTAKEDRAARREEALGKVMLALMDERVALTGEQRAKLDPIAQDLMRAAPDLIAEPDPNTYFSLGVSQVLQAAGGGSQDQIKAILDSNQWQHWLDAASGKNLNQNMYVEQAIQLPAAGGSATPTPPPLVEPDAVDKAISRYLADKNKTAHDAIFAEKELKAEDAARILRLSPDSAQLLQTAACGAAEAVMANWRDSAEQMVRSNLGEVTPDTIDQKLQSIPAYQIQQNMGNGNNSSPDAVWDATVKAVLDADQMKAWNAETDARKQYELDAVCGWINICFAQQFGLSPDQQEKMRPMITTLVKKYNDRMGGFFSGGGDPWYFIGFYMFMPVAGIQDKDLSAVLTKDQIDHWKGSNVYGQASMYWHNISQQ